MSEPRQGDRIGVYRLERPLGQGGMGVVWLATDERLGRPVALKFLHGHLADDASFRLRFLAESRAASALDHPNIVPVYEAGESDGRLFIAMRYVEGDDLATLLETNGPMDPRRVVGLLRGIADALDAAHARALIHRDVKPGNILVAKTASGEHAYLTDFGLTKHLEHGGSLTDAGTVIGSVGYMAPEQVRGDALDGRADDYSLACVAYEALGGVAPFERTSDLATLMAHIQAPIPALSASRPDLAALDPVFRRGLAKDRADRFENAQGLIEAVDAAIGRAPARTHMVGGARAARRPIAIVAAVALLIVAVALLGRLLPVAGSGGVAGASSPTARAGSAQGTVASPTASHAAPTPSGRVVLPLPRSFSGGLPPGTYGTTYFEPRLTFVLGPDWSTSGDRPDSVGIEPMTHLDERQGFYLVRIATIFDDACPPTLFSVRPTIADLLDALRSRSDLTVSAPEPVRLDRAVGQQVDITAKTPLCGGSQVPLWQVSGQSTRISDPGDTTRLIILDVDDEVLAIDLVSDDPDSATAEILQSLKFPIAP